MQRPSDEHPLVGRLRRPDPAGRHRGIAGRSTRVRLPELLLGSGLVVAGALGAVVWSTRGSTQQLAVAARSLHRGDRLSAGMIRWSRISGDPVGGLAAANWREGSVLAADVAAGAVLRATDFSSGPSLQNDSAVIGLALEPGAAPAGLAVGDRVIVVVTPTNNDGAGAAPWELGEPGTIFTAPHPDTAPTGRLLIDLMVSRRHLVAIAGAAHVRLARIEEQIENSVSTTPRI